MKKYPWGDYLALLIASLLFGTMHFGGVKYTLLASVAGIFYGLIYQKTKSIEASIAAHFSLNLAHFTALTYPSADDVFFEAMG